MSITTAFSLGVCSNLSSRAKGDIWISGFIGLLRQDFPNAFVNPCKALSFLGGLWQGVSQFNFKLYKELFYVAASSLAFDDLQSCLLVPVFRKAKKCYCKFTFSTALVISQPSYCCHLCMPCTFLVVLQAIFIALI